MKIHKMHAVVAFAVALPIAVMAVWRMAPVSQTQTRPRHVLRSADKPIPSVLKSDDSEVVIEETIARFDEMQPGPGVSLIDWRLQNGLGAYIVQVEDSKAHLTDKKDWIKSSVILSILTPLRQLEPPLLPGARISIEQDGGTLQLGPTTVTGVMKNIRALREGQKYLLFLSRSTEGGVELLPQAAYRISGPDELEMVSLRAPRDEIANGGLKKTTESIETWVRRGR